MKDKIEALRASVRPVGFYIFAGAIVAITLILVNRFANVDMTMMALGAMLGAGGTIFGFWYGGRQASKQ